MYRMLTIFMFCLAATWSVSAQTAPVPDKYEIETAADCARYNDDVLRCAEWLRTTPYDPTKSDEWLRVAGFLTRWSAGTDEVMYEISEETAPVLGADLGVEKMSLLFSAYLAGGAEYALGGGNGRDAAAVARAGGDAVIEVYRANRGTLGKIREVETMIKGGRRSGNDCCRPVARIRPGVSFRRWRSVRPATSNGNGRSPATGRSRSIPPQFSELPERPFELLETVQFIFESDVLISL